MSWSFSPEPALETALATIARDFPPALPAGLDRFRCYLDALGHPHTRLPFTFHAAGTNGKGSTLAFLQGIFEAGGKSVHKFTSPHLVRFEERIVLNGQMITPDDLLGLIEECKSAVKGEPVSFFEFFTGLAFLAFSRRPADAILLETGLGGLLDATNVVPQTLPIITRISFDHTAILGHTLSEIAAQKAGIMRPQTMAIIAPQPASDVITTFQQKAKQTKALLFQGDQDWRATPTPTGFQYHSASYHFDLPVPSLKGPHQIVNASTAIAAIEKSPFAQGLLHPQILAQGVRGTVWPGRLQHIDQGPLVDALPKGWEIWLDGAHNDSGAEVMAHIAKEWSDCPLHLLTAMKKNKDTGVFYDTLKPFLSSIIILDTDMGAPLQEAQDLCMALQKQGHSHTSIAKTWAEVAMRLRHASQHPGRLLIAGSLYLAGYVLRSHGSEGAKAKRPYHAA